MSQEQESAKCGMCEDVLRELCNLPDGQEFCRMRDRYQTDPAYSPDDVLYDLKRKTNPGQVELVKDRLRVKYGWDKKEGS